MAQPQEFKEVINNLRNEMPAQIELTVMKAQLCREYYVELINQGFSKDESLELCKFFKIGG